MKFHLTVTVAGAALLAGMSVAAAQTTSAPGSDHTGGSASGAAQSGTTQHRQSAPPAGNAAPGTTGPSGEGTERGGTGGTGSAGNGERQHNEPANNRQHNEPANRQNTTNPAEPQSGQGGQAEHGRSQTERGGATSGGHSMERGGHRSGASTGSTNAEQQGHERGAGGAAAEGQRGGHAGGHVSINTNQRTTIRETITKQHVAPARNVHFSISVGTRVPRTVVLHPLPPRIVEVVPEFRGYRFFLLANGEIVVVDPNTLEIVAVINT